MEQRRTMPLYVSTEGSFGPALQEALRLALRPGMALDAVIGQSTGAASSCNGLRELLKMQALVSSGWNRKRRIGPTNLEEFTRPGRGLVRSMRWRMHAALGKTGATVRSLKIIAVDVQVKALAACCTGTSLVSTTWTMQPGFPDVPAIAEQGAASHEASTWSAFIAPAGTPPAIVERLNAEIRRLAVPLVERERVNSQDGLPLDLAPAQFTAFLEREIEGWGRVTRAANIRAD